MHTVLQARGLEEVKEVFARLPRINVVLLMRLLAHLHKVRPRAALLCCTSVGLASELWGPSLRVQHLPITSLAG